MTSLKKRAIVAATEGISEFKRLRRTLSDEDAFGIIGKKFHEKLFGDANNNTTVNYMNRLYGETLRKQIWEEFPEYKGSVLVPKLPEELQTQRNKSGEAQVTEFVKKPIKIDADKMILIAINGLKQGLLDKIYPEVKLSLSFLCCFRSNDLNPNFIRSNNVVPKYGETHSMIEQFPGTFYMLPSKQKEGNEYKEFCNVTIVSQEHYPLIQKAIIFLLDYNNAKLQCYSGLSQYKKRTPCGAQTKDCQWSGRIYQEMVTHVGFKNAILNWNGWEEKQKICETFGRRFVACCIHKEIIRFDDDLNVGCLAADLCLGHVIGSTATRPYLRYDVRPTQISQVLLKQVNDPIMIAQGKEITTGIYLQQT